jgi:Fe-S-cluster containining protein
MGGRVALPVLPAGEAPGAGRGPAPGSVTVTVDIPLARGRLKAEVPVPAAPTTPAALLPVFQAVADAVVRAAVQAAEARRQTISCTKGCGACCRQLVPISATEARRLAALVDQAPEPRRSALRARFADAVQWLEEAGLLEKLRRPEPLPREPRQALGLEYFRQGIPCPFLEEESCSIHPDRPLICREHLVTSPAEHCARPSAETVRRVRRPAQVSRALAGQDAGQTAKAEPWVPPIRAIEWAETEPAEPAARPGAACLPDFFNCLAGGDKPAAAPGSSPAEAA